MNSPSLPNRIWIEIAVFTAVALGLHLLAPGVFLFLIPLQMLAIRRGRRRLRLRRAAAADARRRCGVCDEWPTRQYAEGRRLSARHRAVPGRVAAWRTVAGESAAVAAVSPSAAHPGGYRCRWPDRRAVHRRPDERRRVRSRYARLCRRSADHRHEHRFGGCFWNGCRTGREPAGGRPVHRYGRYCVAARHSVSLSGVPHGGVVAGLVVGGTHHRHAIPDRPSADVSPGTVVCLGAVDERRLGTRRLTRRPRFVGLCRLERVLGVPAAVRSAGHRSATVAVQAV